jgi:regulator of protease activity HflC (stomatin/prohibitin superfamily)
MVILFVDRVRPLVDLRETVVRAAAGTTEDNLVVNIDTVIYFQVTDEVGDVRDRGPGARDRPAHRDDAAQRGRRHDARGDAHLRETINDQLVRSLTRRLASGASAFIASS